MDPYIPLPFRNLDNVHRARLYTTTRVRVLHVLHVGDVAALVVGLVAMVGVGQSGIVKEVSG